MPGEVEADKEEEKAEESTASPEATAPAPPRPVVGIIYPPPEVRSILPPPRGVATRALSNVESCSVLRENQMCSEHRPLLQVISELA